jgi:hypothetical protein
MTLLGMARPRKVRITQLARSVALRASEVKIIHGPDSHLFLAADQSSQRVGDGADVNLLSA